MLYLNNSNIRNIRIIWAEIVNVIEEAVHTYSLNDYAQPIKPYLRYKDLKNRIIAMPAYLGGRTSVAGIKWIASFPDNIKNNVQRAHSVIILNEVGTGKPLACINSTLVSGIRTAGVSGLLLKKYLSARPHHSGFTAGIVGFGPIGRLHLDMIFEIVPDLKKVKIYDLNKIDIHTIDQRYHERIELVDSWQQAYRESDIFITCTVSKEAYIDIEPPKGSLQLNVSLRDYKPEIKQHIDYMIVDNWEEVCRENTDIEAMFMHQGLKESDTYNIVDLVRDNCLSELTLSETVMFNPMGMAIFDMAVGQYFNRYAHKHNIGVLLEDE